LETADRDASIRQFREEMRPFFQLLPSANILNADQVGINLEMTEGRTLEEKGAKHVKARVQRINATTHSFSIQPLISADGVLHEPTLVRGYKRGIMGVTA
jgi:biotin synthase-related radical SAM superfamily protein